MTQQQETVTKQKNPLRIEQGKKLVEYNRHKKEELRQVLFDIRAGNSNLAKSLIEISNHAMYQHENPHRCLLSLQNLQN